MAAAYLPRIIEDELDEDVRHLTWARKHFGADLLDTIIVTTGQLAYRRRDGVGVVPAALLGP